MAMPGEKPGDYQRLRREAEQLERELERPISPERRRAVEDALRHVSNKVRSLKNPH